MSPRTYKRRDLASFPKEFFTAWDLAIAEKLEIEFPSKARATSWRHQMYSFRKRYSEEGVDLRKAGLMYDVDLEITELEPGGKALVSCGQLSWKRQIKDLAVETSIERVQEAIYPKPVSNAELPPEPPASDPMADALANLGFGPEEKDKR